MKLQADQPQAMSILAYGPGWVQLPGQAPVAGSLILSSEGLQQPWDCPSFEALTQAHMQQLATLAEAHGIQVVLLGSGTRTRFVPPAWLRPLAQQQLGLEAMDSNAACRTFNVLAGEGRKVMLALIQESQEPNTPHQNHSK